jgi:8-oxo-dGTP pyrophosphatase MutT (NUDIX family)
MNATSCGLLLCNPQSELLLCHATGTPRWDLPKGLADPGEAPEATVLRETAEETGLLLSPDDLLALGRHAYRPGKDLVLYAALCERFDAARCRCRSRFHDRHGRLVPEMDRYAWTSFTTVTDRCAPAMGKLLTVTLSLPDLLARLQARGRIAEPQWIAA